MIDSDRQGAPVAAIAARTEAGKMPGIACAQYSNGPTLRGQVQQQRDRWQDIIIDAGGPGQHRAPMTCGRWTTWRHS